MSVRVEIDPQWRTHIDGEISQMLHNLGADIVSDMQRVVPVDSGDLKESLGFEVEDGKLYVYAGEKYAPEVELGTVKMAAQPYMRPSTYKNRSLR